MYPTTTAQRRSEERRVISDLKAENFIKLGDQPKNAQPKPREKPNAYASIPHIKGVSAFKLLKTLGHVLKKPKDRPTKEHLKGIVYKVSCRTCPFTYIGESKLKKLEVSGG